MMIIFDTLAERLELLNINKVKLLMVSDVLHAWN